MLATSQEGAGNTLIIPITRDGSPSERLPVWSLASAQSQRRGTNPRDAAGYG